ncbi:dynein heavy chain 5, axonemal, partial [Austrofundulus limnaeus]|uniref:Dynein heavy chain 5, axonemal n=1 Tax=Austrofundulus limnaeus TaxID=52670 RepID=A0A2I4AKQ6_AUSLI
MLSENTRVRAKIQTTFEQLYVPLVAKLMLSENTRVKIQTTFEQLYVPHVAKVDEAILPGLDILCWKSLNIDTYLGCVDKTLVDLELLVDRVKDLVEFRIDAVLQEMSNSTLC